MSLLILFVLCFFMLPFVVLTHLESLYVDLALTVTLLFGKFNSCFWLHKNSINSFMSYVILTIKLFSDKTNKTVSSIQTLAQIALKLLGLIHLVGAFLFFSIILPFKGCNEHIYYQSFATGSEI